MRIRLILAFVLIVLVSVTSVVFLARQNTASEVRAFMFRGGMAGADGLIEALRNYYSQKGTWDGVEALFEVPVGGNRPGSGGANPGQGMMSGMGAMMNQRFQLADGDKRVVYASDSGNLGRKLSRQELRVALPIETDGHTVGYLLAEGGMGFSPSDQGFLVSRLDEVALTAGLIAAGFSTFLALVLAYSLVRPIQELTRAAGRLGKGDLTQRVEVPGTDELAILGRAFNQMADSLQKAEESRKAMTADIAHELRNPLAVQRANLEALQDGIYPLTKENLQPVLEQNQLLNRLVEDLRTLALADSGQLQLELSSTGLRDLVERVAERFKPTALAHQVQLHLVGFEPEFPEKEINLDAMRVEQILNNLLSNALRYTPQGGRIRIEVSQVDGWVEVSIQDSGPGIPESALPHVFERFYRVDKARSRSEGGTGLGLAIARQLAQAHGGKLEAANHPEGGAVFTLSLPAKGCA